MKKKPRHWIIKNEEKMSVRIAKERSDLCDLTAAAIKATYDTRNVSGVERCIYALNHLKSLSLSVKDIKLSESIIKLETLRSHRNPKIRTEARALFHSWFKTIYAQGRDNSFNAALTKAPLKLKKHVLTRCSELKKKEEGKSMAREVTAFSVLENKEDESSQTLEAVKIERKIKLSEMNKKEDQISLPREPEKIKKEERNDLLALKQNEDHKSEKYIKKESKTDLKPLNLKRIGVALEDGSKKKPREDVPYVISSLTKKTKKEDQRSLVCETKKITKEARNDLLKQKEGHKAETCDEKYFKKESKTDLKLLINLKRAFEDCSKEESREVVPSCSLEKKTNTENELRKKKVDEMEKLFEAGKKAADLANAKGVIRGKPEVSRCVDALSLLMKINIAPKPKEPSRMMERLEGLTKHKDRKIVHVASALLHLWRQRIREDEIKESVAKKRPNYSHKAH